jgi:hypothetical protein
MNNYFEREIKGLEREIIALKTANQKSAGNLQLVSKTIPISIPLVLNEYQTFARGRKTYAVRKNSEELVVAYLDWYTDDISREWVDAYTQGSVRSGRIAHGVYNGTDVFQITVYGDRNDIDAMAGGASITISLNMTVKCTNDFTLEAL